MPFQLPHLKRHPGWDMVVAEVRECVAPARAVNPASQRLHIHNNRNNRRSSNRHPSPLRRHGNHEARGCDRAWLCVYSQPLPMLDGGPCLPPNDRAVALVILVCRMSWRFCSSGNSADRRRQMRDAAQNLNPFAVVNAHTAP